MVDLHTHSAESDGTLGPAELVRLARDTGLSALALTDHDTTAGLAEAERAAAKAGIRLIPGIEIEVSHTGGEFHLLGLGISGWRGALTETLQTLQRERTLRNHVILGRMRDAGLDVDYSEVEDLAGGEIVGRPHFARLLVSKGFAKNTDDAFQRFLKPGMPYYAPKKALTLREAAELVHSAGGKAVIAHPLSLYLGWGALPDRIKAFRDEGVDGLEAYHSNASYRECRRLEDIARGLDLLVTAGSDFHGNHIPSRRLGRTCDGRPIDDIFAAPFL
jgi:predicted metal-dependent phosphoesterase TrpH